MTAGSLHNSDHLAKKPGRSTLSSVAWVFYRITQYCTFLSQYSRGLDCTCTIQTGAGLGFILMQDLDSEWHCDNTQYFPLKIPNQKFQAKVNSYSELPFSFGLKFLGALQTPYKSLKNKPLCFKIIQVSFGSKWGLHGIGRIFGHSFTCSSLWQLCAKPVFLFKIIIRCISYQGGTEISSKICNISRITSANRTPQKKEC